MTALERVLDAKRFFNEYDEKFLTFEASEDLIEEVYQGALTRLGYLQPIQESNAYKIHPSAKSEI